MKTIIAKQPGPTTRRAACIVLVVCILAVGTASPAVALGAISSRPVLQEVVRFDTASCMFDLPAGLIEGDDIECGYLTVPQEYANPSGGTLRLAVAILRSESPNPQPDPLVLLQGGPGGSTIYTYMQLIPMTNRLRADRDIIMFDQRGTLYSDPALTCPELLNQTIETLDQNLSEEENNRLGLQAIRECHDRLEREGIDLSVFDSLENAADVESLRRALGYDQINLYGVSYGTLLAQHVLRNYPDGLRSVILDSVVAPQMNFLTGAPQTMNRAFEALFSACAADEECNAAFPSLRDVFYDLVDRLDEEPAEVRLTDFETFTEYDALVNGETFLTVTFQMMYSTELIPYIPQMIYDVRAGDFAFFERIQSVLVFDRSVSYGMYYSVLCAEDADFTPEDYDLEGLPPQIQEMEDDSAGYILQACEIWNVDEMGSEVDQPVQSDVPTLVLSGAFDPITPPEYAEIAAEGLSNSYRFVFPAGGHGAATSGECQDQIILDFLADPATQPESGCIEAMNGPDFITPGALVRLPVLTRLLNLQDGTGFQALFYFLSLLVLLTALVVYPLVWIVRSLGRRPAPAVTTWNGAPTTPVPQPSRGGLYRLAPWISGLNALALLGFTAILIGVVINMITANDTRLLLGLPGSARPLFVLPPLAAVLTLLMLLAALLAWARGVGSAWGRIYLTLISFAALVCVIILALWGMLTGLFA